MNQIFQRASAPNDQKQLHGVLWRNYYTNNILNCHQLIEASRLISVKMTMHHPIPIARLRISLSKHSFQAGKLNWLNNWLKSDQANQ